MLPAESRLLRQASGFFKAVLEVVEYVLGYVDFK